LPQVTAFTPAQITAVASFYPRFRLKPGGIHNIQVCVGTACHVKGADEVFQAFRRYLHITENDDTDEAGLFTVEKVACLGCCMLAPAVRIDNIIYGWVKTDKVGGILSDFLAGSNFQDAAADSSSEYSGEVRLCSCSACAAAGSDAVLNELIRCRLQLAIPVKIIEVSCSGNSAVTPLVEIHDYRSQRSYYYANVTVDTVGGILLRHFRPARLTRRLSANAMKFAAMIIGSSLDAMVCRCYLPEYETFSSSAEQRQCRIATAGAGKLMPLNLSDYRANQGFDALLKILGKTPEDIIAEIEDSGLRGRGGAGFYTGKKWRFTSQEKNPRKYVVCNADEGDPGAFMDRMLLESFPFRVIEGILIAARAVGAQQGFIYVREEYALAVERVRQAVTICRDAGLLGDNINNSDFCFDLKVVDGAGAFVCGEETALIAALHGRCGTPSRRPPYPAQSGFNNCPTLINNVETFATVPWIITRGSAAFCGFGVDSSRGTKTFALAGKIKNGGVIEVPLGATIREIVEVIGGGVPGGTFKAVQIGGPSGGCIPAVLADLTVDYESLEHTGAIMGSGGMVVLDNDDCMVDLARYFLNFTQRESCGRCVFCRIGTARMLEILENLCSGTAKTGDLEKLEDLAAMVKQGSLCGLGKTSPNPVLTTLHFFRHEYQAHLEKRCPAGKCRKLISYEITEHCIGCTICVQNCPEHAIEFAPYQRQEIIQSKCSKCGTCRKLCPQKAIKVK
jgi:NADH-quinone oxidoreductase subunit F